MGRPPVRASPVRASPSGRRPRPPLRRLGASTSRDWSLSRVPALVGSRSLPDPRFAREGSSVSGLTASPSRARRPPRRPRPPRERRAGGPVALFASAARREPVWPPVRGGASISFRSRPSASAPESPDSAGRAGASRRVPPRNEERVRKTPRAPRRSEPALFTSGFTSESLFICGMYHIPV